LWFVQAEKTSGGDRDKQKQQSWNAKRSPPPNTERRATLCGLLFTFPKHLDQNVSYLLHIAFLSLANSVYSIAFMLENTK
jgi:hypothetical protein